MMHRMSKEEFHFWRAYYAIKAEEREEEERKMKEELEEERKNAR